MSPDGVMAADIKTVGPEIRLGAGRTQVTATGTATSPRRLAFSILCEPVPMPRPRVTIRGGRPHGYIPTGAAQACWEIRQAAARALADEPRFEGAVKVDVTAYLRMPASTPKRDRATALPVRRPDLDNLLKTVLDGLSCLWTDDAQAVDVIARKRYAVDSSPRWEVLVEAMATGPDSLTTSLSVSSGQAPPETRWDRLADRPEVQGDRVPVISAGSLPSGFGLTS